MAEILGDVSLDLVKNAKQLGNPFSMATYYAQSYLFGFVVRTDNRKNGLPEFAPITLVGSCRETFISHFKNFIRQKYNIKSRRGGNRGIYTQNVPKVLGRNKKIGILVVPSPFCTSSIKKADRENYRETSLMNAVEVLNAIESSKNWPKSVCYRIEGYTHKARIGYNADIDMKSYVVEVSKKWFYSPHLISFVTLVLRSGYKFAKVSKTKGLPNITVKDKKEALDILSHPINKGITTDTNRLKQISKYLPIMIDNYEDIFNPKFMVRYFYPVYKDPKGSLYREDVGGLEGIDYMMQGRAASGTFREKLRAHNIPQVKDRQDKSNCNW